MVQMRGRLGRALRNDRGIYCSILEAPGGAPVPQVFRTHHNAVYGIAEFLSGMVHAAGTNRTLAAAARALRRALGGRSPSGEWYRERLASATDGQAGGVLAVSAAGQLAGLARAGCVKGTCLVAVDEHDVGRRDRRPGPGPVRSREKDGTQLFGRVMAAQCVGDGPSVTLATGPVGVPDDATECLRRLVATVRLACETAGAEPVLPLDRGFPSVGALRVLREGRVDYCMMLRRTDNVVRATREHAAGTRPRVSTATMESSRGTEQHAIVIVPGKRLAPGRGAPPEARFVAFAVSAAWVDVEWHARRRGIETRCREPGRSRIRTASTNPAGRALCMAHSLIMPSAWAVAMTMAALASRLAARGARVTHSGFCDVAVDMAEQGLLLPEPHPPVLP